MEYFDLTELLVFGILVLFTVIARHVVPWPKNKINDMGNDDLEFWLDNLEKEVD